MKEAQEMFRSPEKYKKYDNVDRMMEDILGEVWDCPLQSVQEGFKISAKTRVWSDKIKKVITALANGETLEAKYRDHLLTGDHGSYRECHIQPDWLLVYQIDGDQLILFLARTGTHSDLF